MGYAILYSRAAQFEGLSAEASYRLQKVGVNGVEDCEVNNHNRSTLIAEFTGPVQKLLVNYLSIV